MTFGSLFAGIGGMDLGLERAGMECRWQVEIDPFCRKVLAKHWPDVKRYEDVRTVDWSEVERVDLIAGGFPCQDISNAGKRVGIEGERSGLWSEYARAIRELRPALVLVENVTALLARGIERVLGDLAALGYDAEWDCIPAAAVGAPHIRDRFFLVAHAESVGGSLRATEGGRAWGSPSGRDAMADATGLRDNDGWREQQPSLRSAPRDVGAWLVEPDVGRVAHGVPNRVDRLRGLGNAVVPQVAEWIGRRILDSVPGDSATREER